MHKTTRLSYLFISIVTGFVFFVLAAAAPPPAPGDYLVGGGAQAGGRPYQVAVSGSLVYIGQDTLVRTLDATNPAAMASIGRPLSMPNSVTSLAVADQRLYAATFDEVYIADAANPGDLRALGVFTGAASVHALAALGQYVYVGDDNHGVLAVDVSDPAHPVRTGVVTITAPVNDLVIAGRVLFAATGGDTTSGGKRLYAIGLDDPAHPVALDDVTLGGVVRSVAVSGHYAYATTDGVDLRIVDVLTPTQLQYIPPGLSVSGSSYDVLADGSTVYLTTLVSGNPMQIVLNVVDASTPSTPTLITTLPGLGAGVYAALRPGTAFVADDDGGRVFSIDVSVPAAAHVAGIYAGPARPRAVARAGLHAAVADYYNGLSVLDLDNPSSRFAEVGRAGVNDLNMDVACSGTLAYLVSSNTGLRIFDLSVPSAPALLGALDTAGAASGVAVRGTMVYVADGGDGLRFIDASVPTNPVARGGYPAPEWVYAAAVGPRPNGTGTLAYLADAGWLRIVDVTTPSAPIQIGYVNTGGTNVDVVISGTLVYLANSSLGMLSYDVTNPAAPQQSGSYVQPGIAGISAGGDYAGLAADTAGLVVLDVSTPLTPTLVGVYDPPGTAYGVSGADGTFLVADGVGGVQLAHAFKVKGVAWLPLMRR